MSIHNIQTKTYESPSLLLNNSDAGLGELLRLIWPSGGEFVACCVDEIAGEWDEVVATISAVNGSSH